MKVSAQQDHITQLHVSKAISGASTGNGRPRTSNKDGFQASLDKTYGALHSRRPNDASAISEQDLYAANAHQALAKLNPGSGERFLTELTQIAPKIAENHGTALGFKAADRVMRAMVRDGTLSHAEYRDIRASALGRSQIDSDRTSLSRTNLKASTDGAAVSRITIQSKVESNAVATVAEVQAFKHFERTHPTRIDRAAEVGGKATISGGSVVASDQITPPTSSPPVSTPAAPESIGGDTLIPDKQIKAKTGFLWKPVSDSDGRLAILLPPALTGRSVGVQVLSPDGNRVLATGRYSGVGNGFRDHFRFDRSGGNFPPNSIVKVTLNDGQVGTVLIERPGQRNE